MDLSDAEARKYLGLTEKGPFKWSQIPAKLLVLEFYSLYCPVCQRQAPKINKIYSFIQDDPALEKDIKVLGVGLTNKPKEIDVYRKTFRIKFPLIADPEKAITNTTGIEDIPLTLVIDKNGKVLMSHLGAVKSPDTFVKELKEYLKKQK
jgi:peroxiredoxin